ncbi:MAG: YrhK family protein [Pseudooceanicola sp.]
MINLRHAIDTFFRHESRQRNSATREAYARYEIAYTIVDFFAALGFVFGSFFFFWESTKTLGIWAFLVGSILFAAKPTIRLAREMKLYRLGYTKDLAERLNA